MRNMLRLYGCVHDKHTQLTHTHIEPHNRNQSRVQQQQQWRRRTTKSISLLEESVPPNQHTCTTTLLSYIVLEVDVSRGWHHSGGGRGRCVNRGLVPAFHHCTLRVVITGCEGGKTLLVLELWDWSWQVVAGGKFWSTKVLAAPAAAAWPIEVGKSNSWWMVIVFWRNIWWRVDKEFPVT